DPSGFLKRYQPGHSLPVRLEVDADTETPVSAFIKLSRGESHAFLFESVEGGERSARWSFLGVHPRRIFSWRLGDRVEPMQFIERGLKRYPGVRVEGTPRFAGGWVGYLSYDAVQLFEPRVPIAKPDELSFPDVLLMDFDTVLAFDNVRHTVQVITEARCTNGRDPRALYQASLRRLERVVRALRRPLQNPTRRGQERASQLRPRVSRRTFEAAVRRAREYIRAGDCQQIVLSQRFDAETGLPP